MKITSVEPIILQYKLNNDQKFAYSQAWYNTRTIMILRIETDEGIVGWGEAFGPAFVHKSIIDTVYAPKLIGMDPFDSEVIWETLYNCLQDHGQKGVIIEAISAIDIALWDIKGKALNMPIYKLLGGAFRERVKPYATGLYHREADDITRELVEEAENYVKQGYLGIKLKIGFGIQHDIKNVAAIRKAIGSKINLMVDANHAYNAKDAIKLGKMMEEYDITWFEEPVPPEDIDGYIEVKNNVSIPIAGGEAEFTRYGFNRFINMRAADIIQPDCCVMGGISEYRKIITLASINNIQCYPHIWGSAIAVAAGIHAAFSQPDFPKCLIPQEVWLELDRTPNIFREELAINKFEIKDGYLYKPQEPGLGIIINEELIKKYRIA